MEGAPFLAYGPLASEPYTNEKNQIPHVHKDLTPYYWKKGTSKHRAAILIHKTLSSMSATWLITVFNF